MENEIKNNLVISLMLAVTDAPRAVTWYEEALGATVWWSLGSVAGLEVQGAAILCWRTCK